MFALYVPALIVAFLITLLELTEVAALIFALSADQASVRPATFGAIGGTALVSVLALGFAAVLIALPPSDLLWASAVVLAAFGVFLFRSTVRSYRRASAAPGTTVLAPRPPVVQFGGGFSVGAIETTEAVIVLLALAAAGYGYSALIGAIAGALVLVITAAVVHDRIRRIKVPWLKLGGTSLLLSFALFWGGEAAGVPWPGGDLILLPMLAGFVLLLRGAVALALQGPTSTAVA